MSLEQWLGLFRKTCGQDWPRPKARLDRLARQYGIEHDPSRPEIILFALQSWYVLLVKLLAGHVLAAVRGGQSPAEAAAGGDARGAIAALADGRLFASLAATDPWAGEPFAWPARGVDAEIQQAVTARGRADRRLRSASDYRPCRQRRRSAQAAL